jgi:hypothetical protein
MFNGIFTQFIDQTVELSAQNLVKMPFLKITASSLLSPNEFRRILGFIPVGSRLHRINSSGSVSVAISIGRTSLIIKCSIKFG